MAKLGLLLASWASSPSRVLCAKWKAELRLAPLSDEPPRARVHGACDGADPASSSKPALGLPPPAACGHAGVVAAPLWHLLILASVASRAGWRSRVSLGGGPRRGPVLRRLHVRRFLAPRWRDLAQRRWRDRKSVV